MTALLLQFWPYIVTGLAALAGLWKAYSMGKATAEAKHQAEELKADRIADQVDNDVGALTPAQRRKELGEWGR